MSPHNPQQLRAVTDENALECQMERLQHDIALMEIACSNLLKALSDALGENRRLAQANQAIWRLLLQTKPRTTKTHKTEGA